MIRTARDGLAREALLMLIVSLFGSTLAGAQEASTETVATDTSPVVELDKAERRLGVSAFSSSNFDGELTVALLADDRSSIGSIVFRPRDERVMFIRFELGADLLEITYNQLSAAMRISDGRGRPEELVLTDSGWSGDEDAKWLLERYRDHHDLINSISERLEPFLDVVLASGSGCGAATNRAPCNGSWHSGIGVGYESAALALAYQDADRKCANSSCPNCCQWDPIYHCKPEGGLATVCWVYGRACGSSSSGTVFTPPPGGNPFRWILMLITALSGSSLLVASVRRTQVQSLAPGAAIG